MVLDIRTIMTINIVTSIAGLAVMLIIWRQARGRFSGTQYWVYDYAFQTAAMFLMALRGRIWDGLSIVLANLLIAGAMAALYNGLLDFYGLKWPRRHNYILVAVFTAVQAYFSLYDPNLTARNYSLSLVVLILCGQSCYLAYAGSKSVRKGAMLLAAVMLGFCLTGLVRIVTYAVSQPVGNDYFQSGMFEAVVLTVYMMLNLMVTYALILLVNMRLGREITEQEEVFAIAFRSAPYAILLTSVDKGEIIDVNTGFEKYTGYTRAETLGRTTLELKLWMTEQERTAVIGTLKEGRKVSGREVSFRMKNGQKMHTLFTAEIVNVKERPCVLSSIMDITEIQGNREQLFRQVAEMKAMNTAMLDRENRVMELKKEINQLLEKLGQPKKYGG